MANDKIVRIGGASAAWGDSTLATPQLLAAPSIDYLVYDYLAETTMAILARQKQKHPDMGYAHDFVTGAIGEHLETIARRGVKLVANAGGLNPVACARAIERLARDAGVSLRVAAVVGDDVMAEIPALRAVGARCFETGEPLPGSVLSANAYTGAAGIARALALGAQVVVTGRCVDSAVALGPLAHEFGWAWDDFDRLAQGSLAGHIIECGAQATGGLFTDWDQVPDWDCIGYPILECAADGSFVVTKPEETGGLVSPAAVAEQILYELGDPAAYILADVICDFRNLRVETAGTERVRVSGACGRAPTNDYKVSVTYERDFQIEALQMIRGLNAQAKAKKTAEAFLARTRRMMAAKGLGDYAETRVEYLGTESMYGPHGRIKDAREVVLRIAARHPSRAALECLRKELASAGVSMGPGTRGHFGGRPEIRACIRHFATLIPKQKVKLRVLLEDRETPVEVMAPVADPAPRAPEATGVVAGPPEKPVTVPLLRLAHARSGDKGNTSNIGVIARKPEYLPWIRRALTPEAVGRYFAHLMTGNRVERHELPGLNALNFLLHDALAGGGTSSLSSDPLGKSYAQILLDFPVEIPADLAIKHGRLDA
ncbi:MAG: DUF1446 domain-containing protein [Betaproteobacteria bacterium]|nr:DUF1446 domain-containing protein [Betaproteobacteria bacterium]